MAGACFWPVMSLVHLKLKPSWEPEQHEDDHAEHGLQQGAKLGGQHYRQGGPPIVRPGPRTMKMAM